MSDVQIGLQVLDYATRVSSIVSLLGDASAAAHRASDLLAGDEGFYDGEARPEMKQFYDGYAADIDKLSYFESVAGHYLTQVFDDFTFTDQDLAAIVTAWLGEH